MIMKEFLETEQEVEETNEWANWLGKKIMKKSKKPFKSKKIVGISNEIVINPHSGKFAFFMEEDKSVVDCRQCMLVE